MIPLERVNEEVFVAEGPVVIIGPTELDFIKSQALISPKQRARICAHSHSSDLLHEMFIALSKNTYVQPHRHRQKSESFHIIEGKLDVVLFEDDGRIHKVIALGDPSTRDAFFYRLDSFRYHTIIIKSELLVMHEVTNGPFERNMTDYAPFAPRDTDPIRAVEYNRHLLSEIQAFRDANS